MSDFPAKALPKSYVAYKITDPTGLIYVGMTSQTFDQRLRQHKYDKKFKRNNCSSALLDLDNCNMSAIQYNISTSNKKEIERYWIHKLDCVNSRTLDMDTSTKEGRAAYYLKNRDKILASAKKKYKENKGSDFKSKSGIKYISFDKNNCRWRIQIPMKGKMKQKTFYIKRDAIVAKFCYILLNKI